MKKTIIITGVVFLVLAGLYFYAADFFKKEEVAVKETTVETEKGEQQVIEVEQVDGPSVEKEFPMTMTEGKVRVAIHGMSHQKVQADKKWDVTLMTEERIERLIQVVEANATKYEHSNLYLDILKRWAAKDFTRADKDHNAIWKLQGGTVGEAKGVMSVEEERRFIQQNFDVETVQ